MRQAPAYSSDRLPGDFAASLLSAAIAGLVSGPLVWYLALTYMHRTYPNHPELNGAAAFLGIIDGLFVGGGAFVVTFAVRVWLHERRERKHSDDLLRAALEEIARGDGGL